MSRVIEHICKCRDILIGDPKKIQNYTSERGLFDKTIDEIHRHISKKSKNYSYQLDFTYQDLVEFADDIHRVLNKWDTAMCPKKNIKALLKTVENGKLDLNPFCESRVEIISLRAQTCEGLIRALSILEYHAVFLYFIEEASKDSFALTFTERF